MNYNFWAQRRKNKVGPFPTREEALNAFRTIHPFNGPLYSAKAPRNAITTGYGKFGPHFDIRWHSASSAADEDL